MAVVSALAFAWIVLLAQDTPIAGSTPASPIPVASATPDDGFTDPKKVIDVRVGGTFALVLDSNPTTGYSWRLQSPPPPAIALLGSVYHTNRPILPGTGGREIWTFKAVNKGDASVSIEYVRPFDKVMVANAVPTVFRVHIVP